MNEKKKYIVSTKCGHVGKNKYIVIDFVVNAKSAKEAAKIARNIPRVKHHWKNAIEEVREVTPQEYKDQLALNSNDNYLKAKCIQEQRRDCSTITDRIHVCDEEMNETKEWLNRRERIHYKMKKLDIIKRHSLVS